MNPAALPASAAISAQDAQPHDVEAEILRLARDEPTLGQAAVAERLRQEGRQISASGVRYIWQKHGLETTVKRLQALASQSGDGLAALTDNQRRLLERGEVSAQLSAQLSAQQSRTGAEGEDGERGEEEQPERRQLIINAAAKLFSEQGYDRSSIRDIAREVGLLPGSVYHYFASKEELYLAVHREGFTRVLAKVKAAAATGTDPWDCLTRACVVHINGIVEGSPVDRITGHNLAITGNRELFAKIQPLRDDYEAVFRGLVHALPVAPGTDLSVLRLFLLGGMNWVYLWYHQGRRTPEEIAHAMVDMLRRGVQA